TAGHLLVIPRSLRGGEGTPRIGQPRESDQGALNAIPPHYRWRRSVERRSAGFLQQGRRRHAGAVFRSSRRGVIRAREGRLLRAPLVRLPRTTGPITGLTATTAPITVLTATGTV